MEQRGTPPAERGLGHLLFQRHLHHFQRCGGQPAAGRIRLCLWHDWHSAQPAGASATWLAGLLAGALVGKMGTKPLRPALTIGCAVGYGLTPDRPAHLLALAFFIVGIAKGSVLNTCTILCRGAATCRLHRGMNTPCTPAGTCGAPACPFLISAAARSAPRWPCWRWQRWVWVLWLVHLFTPWQAAPRPKKLSPIELLRSSRFWLLTGLLFCQNAEQSVVGWMVTYFMTAASLQARWRPIPSP